MPVYRQIVQKNEEGTGLVTVEFFISDSYPAIFNSEALEIDILEFGSSKKDLEISTGAQKEDEIDFTVNEASVKSDADKAAFDLLLTADRASVWIAEFIHESLSFVSADTNYLEFSGKVRPKMTIKELVWHGEEWNPNVNALREIKYTAQSFATAVLDKINMADKTEEGISRQGIIPLLLQSDFKIQNVTNPLVYIADGRRYDVYYKGAVKLNKAMEALRLLAVQKIKEEIPDFDLVFEPSSSGFQFTMTRAELETSLTNAKNGFFKQWGLNNSASYKFDLLNTNSEFSPWVSWRMFEVNLIAAGNGKFTNNGTEASFSFARFSSFTDFLYQIAACFGCVLVFTQTNGNQVKLKMTAISGAGAEKVYFKDAIAADIDTQNAGKEKTQTWKGRGSTYTLEGVDYLNVKSKPWEVIEAYVSESYNSSSDEKGAMLALTVSPNIVKADWGALGLFPLNSYDNNDRFPEATTIPHSAIMGAAPDGLGNTVVTPAGAVSAMIGGFSENFDTLSGAINARLNKNYEYYKTELKIDIPYLCGFSRNADGSDASWKNLTLGSALEHEGREYIVVGIERNFSNWKTTVKATRTSKYAYSEAIPPAGLLPPPPVAPDANQKLGVAAEEIVAGSPVAIGADGKIYLFRAHHSYYGRFAGVSALGGDSATKVIYNEYGRVSLLDSDFEPGKKLFVGADSKITTTPLIDKTANEDLFIEIGRTTEEPNVIYVEKGIEAIFYPPLPEP